MIKKNKKIITCLLFSLQLGNRVFVFGSLRDPRYTNGVIPGVRVKATDYCHQGVEMLASPVSNWIFSLTGKHK